jgi:hypothetical protein
MFHHKEKLPVRDADTMPSLATLKEDIDKRVTAQLSRSFVLDTQSNAIQALHRLKKNEDAGIRKSPICDIPTFVVTWSSCVKFNIHVYVPTTGVIAEFECRPYSTSVSSAKGYVLVAHEDKEIKATSIDALCLYVIKSVAALECPGHKASYEAIRRVDHLKAYWKLFSSQVAPHYRNIFNLTTSWDASKLQDIWRDLILEVHECLTYSRGIPSNLIDKVGKENKIEISFIDLIRKLEQPKLF